ncbi:helix-turn-helix domain-containing protein [Actinoplanes subtropicus]|uniref:helix-turn-helix domain-containing protein n=1 Tax=Actinoplanes subtropicus TaxID=543632 RepID=UPI001FDFF147|nr:helix-turn-helix transcriptional regulator [Actinoplanes subtropicus]
MKDLMAEGDSPTVARRRVRIALREAREAAGYTQLEVAEEMEWSLSKVIRIENGDVSVAPNDLRPLLGFFRVDDRLRVAELVEAAKVARARQRRAWYQTPEYHEFLTDPLRKLIEFEAEAAVIHHYSVFHVPGLLQVPEYSTALMETWSEELEPGQIKYRLAARRQRHDVAVARAGSLRITALLDESVLRRPVGGPRVLIAQFEELLRLIWLGLLRVRVIRFDADVAMSYNAGFNVVFLGADGDLSSAVMYRETGVTDEILEDVAIGKVNATGPPPPGPVARHYDRYQKLWNAAAKEDDTIAFIERRIRELG